MRLKDWKDCTLGQKIARVVLSLPIILATWGYISAGMWLLWAFHRY